MVQEKNGIFKGTGVWKLPTGVVNEVRTCINILNGAIFRFCSSL